MSAFTPESHDIAELNQFASRIIRNRQSGQANVLTTPVLAGVLYNQRHSTVLLEHHGAARGPHYVGLPRVEIPNSPEPDTFAAIGNLATEAGLRLTDIMEVQALSTYYHSVGRSDPDTQTTELVIPALCVVGDDAVPTDRRYQWRPMDPTEIKAQSTEYGVALPSDHFAAVGDRRIVNLALPRVAELGTAA